MNAVEGGLMESSSRKQEPQLCGLLLLVSVSQAHAHQLEISPLKHTGRESYIIDDAGHERMHKD